MSRRGLRSLLLLAMVVASGALRDFLFVNLNYQIDHLQRRTAFSYAHSAFQEAVSSYGLGRLTSLKWAFSAGFMAFMWFACILLLRWWGRSDLQRYVSLSFAALVGLSIVLHFVGRSFLPAMEASVWISHTLQYPLPPLILFAALRAFHRS